MRVEGDLFHGRIPEGAVYVGRPAPGLRGSYFHNPFKIGTRLDGGDTVQTVEQAIDLFVKHVQRQGARYRERAVRELGVRDLACWCKPGQPCHGDHLLIIANGGDL